MKRAIAVACLTMIFGIIFQGCGSGSGDGSFATNLTSAPGESAFTAYLQGAHNATLNATDAGNSYQLQYGLAPNAGTTTFDGQSPAYSDVETVTLDENGALIANSVSTGYFLLNPYQPLGRVFGTGTPYAVTSGNSQIPATLTVGTTGPLDSVTFYHDSSLAVVDANGTDTYSVESNTSSTLLFCVNSVTSDVTAQGTADGLTDDTETDCYTVDAGGNVNLSTITISVGTVTLDFM